MHYDAKQKIFINPHIEDHKRTLKDALLWKMGHFDDHAEEKSCPKDFLFPLPAAPIDPSSPQATWINHSTYFLQINGLHFLTDPIWSQRCSPLPGIGPIRKHIPPLSMEDLKRVDHVLISHNHYDHLDKATVLALHALYPTICWWVPLGVKEWFVKLGILSVQELDWWDSKGVGSELRFTAVPCQHFSGRSLHDTWKSLWTGWVVEVEGKRLYFVGDTGYNPIDFVTIGKKFSSMDLSLIPIGSYLPRKFMSPVHIDPAQAVRIHQEVGSKKSLGMHWKTFNLSDEATMRPPYDLFLALQKENLSPENFLAPLPGHVINW